MRTNAKAAVGLIVSVGLGLTAYLTFWAGKSEAG